MKRYKPKQYQYRMKRGFFLFPRWYEFVANGDGSAEEIARFKLNWDTGIPPRYRKLKLQKLVDGKWVKV